MNYTIFYLAFLLIHCIGVFIKRYLSVDMYKSQYNPKFKYIFIPLNHEDLMEMLSFATVYWYSNVPPKYKKLAYWHNVVYIINLFTLLATIIFFVLMENS